MDMTYRVSKNAYIELLADMVRRNDSRPLKLLTAFLLTFGQMAAVAVLCVTRLEGSTRLFAIVWSLLLAGITLLRRKTVRQRRARFSVSNTRVSSPRTTGASTSCAPPEKSFGSATATSAFPARCTR